MAENWGPYVGIVVAVVIGLALLLYGQIYGMDALVPIGGGISVAAVGLLTLFIHRS